MSPRHDPALAAGDAAFVRGYVERLQTRAALAVGIEAVCAAAIALLVVAAIRAFIGGGREGFIVALPVAALAAIGWTFYRRRTWTAGAVAMRAEAHEPAFQNALLTAIELDAHPERASARIRDLVARQATRAAARAEPDVLWPARRLATLTGVSLAMAALGVTLQLRVVPLDRTTSAPARRGSTGAAAIDQVSVRVLPPPYAGVAPAEHGNVDRLEILAGSRLELNVKSTAARVDASYAGRPIPLASQGGRAFTGTVDATGTNLLTIAARDGEGRDVDRRAIVLEVREDATPEIVIERPGTDLAAAAASDRVAIEARATDDLGLAVLTLHYTKVTGSGEQFSFAEGELPWQVAPASPREWRATTSRVLSDLGLTAGDLLVYYAKAADRRPGAPPAISDSYVIEVGKPQEAISGGFAVPMEHDREGLSLSALIQKTARLDARRAAMAPDAFAEAARGLAIEQRMVRNEVLFLMGEHGHVEDEEAEAEHSTEIQEGRLQNRGQAELQVATQLMTSAERHLTGSDTRAALVDQFRALAALQRALSRQRYFLKTMPVRSRIDPSRRLSGDLSDARSWQRTPAEDPTRRPGKGAAQRAVLADLARAAHGGSDGPTDLAAIASRLLALDPGSSALQNAAAALVRASSAGAQGPVDQRKAIDAAASAVVGLSRQVPASSAVRASPARAAMQGALADALEPSGRRP